MPDPVAAGAVAKLGAGTAGLLGLSAVWLGQVSQEHGIPERAAVAYVEAGRAEGCDWRDLAAVGWAESGHGTSQVDGLERAINADGVVTPALVIWDVWDYGGGPMGFLHSTWEGGGYSELGEYQDVDVAARATCRYLRAKGYDTDRWSALKSYNGSGAAANAYADKTAAYAAALPADPGGDVPVAQVVAQPAVTGGRRPLGATLEAAWQGAWAWLDRAEARTGKGDTPTIGPITAGLAKAGQVVAPTITAPPAAAPSLPLQVGQAKAPSQGLLIAEKAKAWVGREFRPGAREQCAYWVREVLGEIGLDPGVTAQPLDGWQALGPGMANSFGPDQGQPVPDPALLQPGDVVMFHDTYGNWRPGTTTHVGIYVGGGQVVDRPTASKPVSIRSVAEFKFGGAIRLNPTIT